MDDAQRDQTLAEVRRDVAELKLALAGVAGGTGIIGSIARIGERLEVLERRLIQVDHAVLGVEGSGGLAGRGGLRDRVEGDGGYATRLSAIENAFGRFRASLPVSLIALALAALAQWGAATQTSQPPEVKIPDVNVEVVVPSPSGAAQRFGTRDRLSAIQTATGGSLEPLPIPGHEPVGSTLERISSRRGHRSARRHAPGLTARRDPAAGASHRQLRLARLDHEGNPEGAARASQRDPGARRNARAPGRSDRALGRRSQQSAIGQQYGRASACRLDGRRPLR